MHTATYTATLPRSPSCDPATQVHLEPGSVGGEIWNCEPAHIKQTQNHDVPKTYKFVFIFVVQAISPNKGCPPLQNLQVFYNIVQKAFDPPPFVLNIMLQIIFDRLIKKRVNICPDKIRQNKA